MPVVLRFVLPTQNLISGNSDRNRVSLRLKAFSSRGKGLAKGERKQDNQQFLRAFNFPEAEYCSLGLQYSALA